MKWTLMAQLPLIAPHHDIAREHAAVVVEVVDLWDAEQQVGNQAEAERDPEQGERAQVQIETAEQPAARAPRAGCVSFFQRFAPSQLEAVRDAGSACDAGLNAVAGGNRLNRRMCPSAATPSRQPIFFPSA